MPSVFDHESLWLRGDAPFVLLEHCDDHVDGGGADLLHLLVDAGALFKVSVPVEQGKPTLLGDGNVRFLHPFQHFNPAEYDVGIVAEKPLPEGGRICDGLKKNRNPVLLQQSLLFQKKSGLGACR